MSELFEILNFKLTPHRHFLGEARVVWPGQGPRSIYVYHLAGVIHCGPAGIISTDRFNTAELETAVQTMLRAQLLEHCPELFCLLDKEAGL